ncbi:MAG: hypothetical protein FD130_1486 [Halothiobacillaceae bacterium]|nr:MAG: hypothetical protein FD130_1486 [Halothiobacillaceae bacterium]
MLWLAFKILFQERGRLIITLVGIIFSAPQKCVVVVPWTIFVALPVAIGIIARDAL